jgi:hypothetical protein
METTKATGAASSPAGAGTPICAMNTEVIAGVAPRPDAGFMLRHLQRPINQDEAKLVWLYQQGLLEMPDAAAVLADIDAAGKDGVGVDALTAAMLGRADMDDSNREFLTCCVKSMTYQAIANYLQIGWITCDGATGIVRTADVPRDVAVRVAFALMGPGEQQRLLARTSIAPTA